MAAACAIPAALTSTRKGDALVIVLVLILGIVVATINLVVATLLTSGAIDAALLGNLLQQQPLYAGALVGGPLLLAIVAAVGARTMTASPETPATSDTVTADLPPAASAKPSPDAALRLLSLLQQEARFVDFIQEDIDSYSDDQVGAAVRSIHAGCRKALAERITLDRVLHQEDGSTVTIEPGFEPAKIRLTGNVTGEPPFRGTLEHGGWRATHVSLPLPTGESDATIIAPAEVEIA